MQKEIQRKIGYQLRIGVLVSLMVSIIGGVLLIIEQKTISLESFYVFVPYKKYISLQSIFLGLEQEKGEAIVQVGILLLILTPIFRILLSLFSFVKEKDYTYILITSLVLLILFLNIFVIH